MVAKTRITKSARKHLAQLKEETAKGTVHVLPQSSEIKVGKKKTPAHGLTDQQAKGQVLGSAIVKHVGEHDSNLFNDMNQLIQAGNLEFHSNCYGVVLHARDEEKTRIKNTAEEQITVAKDTLDSGAFRKTKKAIEARMKADINNAAVKFSRIIKVIQVIGERYATAKPKVVDFGGCANFANMVSVARLAVPNAVGQKGALTKGGYDAWVKKMSRIVDVSNWADDSKDSLAQRERLEAFIKDAVLYYIKVGSEIVGLRPLGELIPVGKPAKLRKAA